MIGQGNLINQIEILRKNIRKIKYPYPLNLKELENENPEFFLQVIHFVFIDYDKQYYKQLLDKEYDMFSKNDLRFMECSFRLLVKEYKYKPAITLTQFFSGTYLEQKVMLTNDIITIVLDNSPRYKEEQILIKKQQQVQNVKQKYKIETDDEDDDELEREEKMHQLQLQQQKKMTAMQKQEENQDIDRKNVNQILKQINPQNQSQSQNKDNQKNLSSSSQAINLSQNFEKIQVNQGQTQNVEGQQILGNLQSTLDQIADFDRFFSDENKNFQEKSQIAQNSLKQISQQENLNQQLNNKYSIDKKNDVQEKKIQKNVQDFYAQKNSCNNINSHQSDQISHKLQNQYQQQQQPTNYEQQYNRNQQQQSQNQEDSNIYLQQNQKQQDIQKSQQNVSKKELNEVLKLIVDMNSNVNGMMKKFETFKGEVSNWVSNTNAQVVLLDNQVKILKAQQTQFQNFMNDFTQKQ